MTGGGVRLRAYHRLVCWQAFGLLKALRNGEIGEVAERILVREGMVCGRAACHGQREADPSTSLRMTEEGEARPGRSRALQGGTVAAARDGYHGGGLRR